MRFTIRTDQVRSRCLEAIAELPLDPVYAVDIGEFKPTRSGQQNNMMQAIVRAIADCWGKDHDNMRDALNMTLMASRELELPSGEVQRVPAKPTHKFNRSEMAEFIDKLNMFCIENGVEVSA